MSAKPIVVEVKADSFSTWSDKIISLVNGADISSVSKDLEDNQGELNMDVKDALVLLSYAQIIGGSKVTQNREIAAAYNIVRGLRFMTLNGLVNGSKLQIIGHCCLIKGESKLAVSLKQKFGDALNGLWALSENSIKANFGSGIRSEILIKFRAKVPFNEDKAKLIRKLLCSGNNGVKE